MDVRIFGEKYLMMNNYDSITIESPKENQTFTYRDSYGSFIAGGFHYGLSEKIINITIKNSNQKNIVNLLDNTEGSDKKSIHNELKNFSGFGIIEEIISNFLTNNFISCICNCFSKDDEYDFNIIVKSLDGKALNVKLAHGLRKWFNGIMEKIETKYKNDCLQFLENNKSKKYYCYVNWRPDHPHYNIFPSDLIQYKILPLDTIQEDTLQKLWNTEEKEEVVFVADYHITDKINLFEERLNQEQRKASLELIDARANVFKVMCNDCIFILSNNEWSKEYLERELEHIIEKHNQSIEKGKRLLKDLEKGERELW